MTVADDKTVAIRGQVLWFRDDPAVAGRDAAVFHEDGIVAMRDGTITASGDAGEVRATLGPDVPVVHYPDALIVPGFIDTHIHYPQGAIIASYGAQLLDWLNTYTFPEEARFGDEAYAAAAARFFCDELARSGTTTAATYCTVHPSSVDALFAEAEMRGMRMIAGKVMMDRNAPPELCDTAEASYTDSKALIARWHGRGRLAYAVTPRFAITSTPAQLDAAGTLMREHDGVYLQTHLSENADEIATVRQLFPDAASYADVYRRHGLIGPRSLFGHCVHVDDGECAMLSDAGGVAALCPTSNLFIGSGLFDMAHLRDPARPVRTALATDVGGGTSFSMLTTLSEAYKVMQLRGQSLPALEGFHMITRGNAAALSLEGTIGTLAEGAEADAVVLDLAATPLLRHRIDAADGDLDDILFALMMLGDDRTVRATYIAGRLAHDRDVTG